MYQLSGNGIIRTSDRMFIPTDPANRDYQEFLVWFKAGNQPLAADPAPIVPKWDALVEKFTFPGNPLYASVAAKVAAADFLTRDHWTNFKLVSMSTTDPDKLAAGIKYLALLLDKAGHPLSAQDIAGWDELMTAFDFPSNCFLGSSDNAEIE